MKSCLNIPNFSKNNKDNLILIEKNNIIFKKIIKHCFIFNLTLQIIINVLKINYLI